MFRIAKRRTRGDGGRKKEYQWILLEEILPNFPVRNRTENPPHDFHVRMPWGIAGTTDECRAEIAVLTAERLARSNGYWEERSSIRLGRSVEEPFDRPTSRHSNLGLLKRPAVSSHIVQGVGTDWQGFLTFAASRMEGGNGAIDCFQSLVVGQDGLGGNTDRIASRCGEGDPNPPRKSTNPLRRIIVGPPFGWKHPERPFGAGSRSESA